MTCRIRKAGKSEEEDQWSRGTVERKKGSGEQVDHVITDQTHCMRERFESTGYPSAFVNHRHAARSDPSVCHREAWARPREA